MAHIEIRVNGTFGQVFVDGQEVHGVRKVSFELEVKTKCPIVKLELVATDMTIDGSGIVPELPDLFKPFYRKVEVADLGGSGN